LPALRHGFRRGVKPERAAARLAMVGRAAHNGKRDEAAEAGKTRTMPTLFRLIAILVVIVGIVYGAMYALANFVHPNIGEISVRVPAERLNK
jgi:hypothetical protein